MTELENDIDTLNQKIREKIQKLLEFKQQGDVLGSYLEFLENQLVVEALQQHAYSIENFDLLEKDRLIVSLRRGDDVLFDWYVNKKKEGYEFNQFTPLYKVMKEDYEAFCAKQLEK